VANEPVFKPVLGRGVASLGLVVIAAVALIVWLVPARGRPEQSVERGPADPRSVFRAGQTVEIWHAGKWYPGRVRSAESTLYFVNYDGFSKSWYEWVDASRLRARR
jgi:hypothetical protein